MKTAIIVNIIFITTLFVANWIISEVLAYTLKALKKTMERVSYLEDVVKKNIQSH